MELTFENIVEYTISEFPQLVSEYKSEYEQANAEDGMNIYMFFGPIVREHFIKLVVCSKGKDENTLWELKRLAEFFEKIAKSKEWNMRTLLSIGVFEGIDDSILEIAKPFLGPECKKLL